MKTFKRFILENLIGLARPKGRVSANPVTHTDPETGEKKTGEYKPWVPPRTGKEHLAGKETWAVQRDIEKNHNRLAKQHQELHKKKKTGAVDTASSTKFYKSYLSARPPRG